MMFPEPTKLSGGMQAVAAVSGSVPGTAVRIGGIAMKPDGTLYAVFL